MDYDSSNPVGKGDFWLCSLTRLVVLLRRLWVDDRGEHHLCGDKWESLPDRAETE
jgi:hypothetical protein